MLQKLFQYNLKRLFIVRNNSRFISSNFESRTLQRKWICRPSSLSKKTSVCPSRTFSFKNVYQVLSYSAPYSQEDKEVILNRINSESLEKLSKLISRPKANLIVNHRPFEVPEQLLDLQGFDVKILELFLSKVFELESQAETKKKKIRLDQPGQIKPKISKSFYRSQVSTIVALSINLFSVAYVQMSVKEKEVQDWSCVKAFQLVDTKFSKATFEHHNVYALSKDIVKKIPKGDIYVWEEFQGVIAKDSYRVLVSKLNAAVFQSSLVALLNAESESKQNCCHVIKPSVIDSLFKLRVGMERVAVSDQLSDIIKFNEIKISESHWNKFVGCPISKVGKEQMGISLLVALGFNHIHLSESNHEKQLLTA